SKRAANMATAREDKDLDLGDWLVSNLTGKVCPGLALIDVGKFTIPWLNEKSGGLQPGQPDTLFIEAWAKHKQYKERSDLTWDKNRSEWKCKFRNSLNSYIKKRKTIIKLEDKSIFGHKVYQFDEEFFKNNFTVIPSSDIKCVSNTLESTSGIDMHRPLVTEDCILKHTNIQPVLQEILPNDEMTDESYLSLPSEYNESISQENENVFTNQNDSTSAKNKSISISTLLDVESVLHVSVSYGIPASYVKNYSLKIDRPACRLYYPSCENRGVENYFNNDVGLTPLEMPGLDDLHEINPKQKQSIMTVLHRMDRGFIIRYDSGHVYVERRADIKISVTSHIWQNYELPRRKSRNHSPLEVKVFDYHDFESSLSQFRDGLINTPPKADIMFTFPYKSSSDRRLSLSPVEVTVTHIKAFGELNAFISKNELPSLIKTSDEDHLDLLLEGLDIADSNDGRLCFDSSNAAFQAAIHQLSEIPEALMTDWTSTEEQNVVAKPLVTEQPVMMITAFCGQPNQLIDKKYVSEKNSICRIFSGTQETQLIGDNFEGANHVVLPLPSEVDPSVYSKSEKINKILKKLQRGVHVMYCGGNIYVERRCNVEVFWTDGVSESFALPRRKYEDQDSNFLELFNFDAFKASLAAFKDCPSGTLPAFGFKLTIGGSIHPERPYPMLNILLQVSVCHLLALQEICRTFGNQVEDFQPLCSAPDSIDRIVQFLKSLTVTAS
ncbi:interferon regulatory factor 8, partial [Biomphalaria glabrata]